jgi:diadenylate cyclase
MWTALRWQNIVDYCAVTLFLYLLLRLAREARALRTAFTIVALYAGALLARNFELLITSWVLEACSLIGVAVLVFTSQSELRYVLLRLNGLFRIWPEQDGAPAHTGRAVAEAALHLASSRTGALIVILGRDPTAGLITGGLPVGAAVSTQLLEAIFQKSSPLHDGAAVIAGDRLVEATAILPLTERQDVPLVYGTRHRAGLGLSERTDALVIVASEERGEVTLMRAGRPSIVNSVEQLAQLLQTSQRRPKVQWRTRASTLLFSDAKLKLISAGVAALIWTISSVETFTTVREVSAPVAFRDVPPGLDVNYKSDPRIMLQLRGSSWLMNSDTLSRLIVHFSLRNAQEGTQRFHVGVENVDLPPGIVLSSASPADVVVRLVRHKAAPSGRAAPLTNDSATSLAWRGTVDDILRRDRTAMPGRFRSRSASGTSPARLARRPWQPPPAPACDRRLPNGTAFQRPDPAGFSSWGRGFPRRSPATFRS